MRPVAADVALGLLDRWSDVRHAFAVVNQLVGDIPKVTPSSKMVGDFATFVVQQDLLELARECRNEEPEHVPYDAWGFVAISQTDEAHEKMKDEWAAAAALDDGMREAPTGWGNNSRVEGQRLPETSQGIFGSHQPVRRSNLMYT